MNRSPQVQSAHEYPGLYKIEIFVPSYFDTYSFFEKKNPLKIFYGNQSQCQILDRGGYLAGILKSVNQMLSRDKNRTEGASRNHPS